MSINFNGKVVNTGEFNVGREASFTVSRFEVIDHTAEGTGRDFVKRQGSPFKAVLEVQDDGRTLKIFLTDK